MLTDYQKELRRASQKRYADKNKEKVLAASKKWNDENKEKLNIAAKNYYHRNKDNQEFKENNAKRVREWGKNNPSKVLEQSSRKRASKLNRLPSLGGTACVGPNQTLIMLRTFICPKAKQ